MKHWPVDFFNLRYQEMFMSRTREQAQYASDIIAQFTRAQPGQLVADFCCGTGDVLDSLVKKGLHGHGVELSGDYVHKAHGIFPALQVVEGDALAHVFGPHFDIVYNWYSSFGYFEPDQNAMLLANMFRQTKPGGLILLEMYNSYQVLMNFRESTQYVRQWHGQTYEVKRDSRIDIESRVLHQRWTYLTEGLEEIYDTSTNLYLPDDIVRLLSEAGFIDIEIFETPQAPDEIASRPLRLNSSRVTVVGRKP